jgi:hypothetical protein
MKLYCLKEMDGAPAFSQVRQGLSFFGFYAAVAAFFAKRGAISRRMIPITNETKVNASHRIPAMENTQ